MKTTNSTQYLEKIVEDIKNKKSIQDIADEIGCRTWVIYNILDKANIRVHDIKPPKFNHNFFTNIESEESAYWLGFMMADGYLIEDGWTIGIGLEESDRGHLEKFKETLGSSVNVYKHPQRKHVRIHHKSKVMYDDLIRHGCILRKTGRVKFPENVDSSLYRHVCRGYFDGNGLATMPISSIAKYAGKFPCKPRFIFGCSGSEDFIRKVYEILVMTTKITTRKLKTPDARHADFRTSTMGKIYEIYHYLYDDSTIWLDRKLTCFKNYFHIIESEIWKTFNTLDDYIEAGVDG